jgi:hypothetical protein
LDLRDATQLSKVLARSGFVALGGFHPGPADCVPDVGRNVPGRTLLLIGNAGPALWSQFTASAEYGDGKSDPLDRFTRRILSAIAIDFGLAPVFPFHGPPYHPFQQWALKAGGFSQSPLGLLAHGSYGPWAAFRAAFVSGEEFGTFELNGKPGPCEACADKPCLTPCPVDAVTRNGYDVAACIAHLRENTAADCMAGCLARRACPYGAEFAQGSDQAGHHMQAFRGMA